MSKHLMSLTVAAALSLGSAASAQEISRKIDVDAKFTTLAWEWKGAPTGRYFGLWTVRKVNGLLEVCGIGVASSADIQDALEARQKSAKLSYNGKVVLEDISFFNQVGSADKLRQEKAHCQSSGVEAKGNKAEIALTFSE